MKNPPSISTATFTGVDTQGTSVRFFGELLVGIYLIKKGFWVGIFIIKEGIYGSQKRNCVCKFTHSLLNVQIFHQLFSCTMKT